MSVRITIIGLGQIGGSFGLALADKKELFERVGHDISPDVSRQAQKLGAVDRVSINLPASVRELAEGASGARERLPDGILEIRNSYRGDIGYGGPKPPRQSGPHNYEITVYALSAPSLPLGPLASSQECLDAVKRHTLGHATVVGVFEQ